MGLGGKRALTIEDVPKRTQPPQEISNMRRANTNESLVSMELAALSSTPPMSSTPPDPSEWAHKQLMGMVNRSADGNRVTGEEDSNVTPPMARSAFSKHSKAKSAYVTPPDHTSPLASSQPLSPTNSAFPRALSPSSSTSSLLPAGGAVGTLRRERTTILENRLKLKREKDQHMARMIMEEESKKVKDKDTKEKLRENEEKTKAKDIREQQEQRLQSYYEQLHEKQQQHTPPSSSEAENTYFRNMRKKIKDIKVKPTLPSVGLDEKIKNFNARVKGFLSTTNPLPIQKFRDKRNSSKHTRNMPIKLNIVDDIMKDLEMQRMTDESALDARLDSRSPASPASTDSSPADMQKKQAARSKRISTLRLANRTTSELQLLVRALDRNLQENNNSIAAAHETCVKIRAEMEKSKTLLTVDIESACAKAERAGMRGAQFASTVQEIRSQLDATRNATTACSDKIKSLEVNVQKVKRAKKPADKFMRYLVWTLIGILLMYLVVNSRTCQMLVVISVFVLAMRTIKERSGYIPPSQHLLTKFMGATPPPPPVEPIEEEEPEDLSSPEVVPMTPSGTHVAPGFSTTPEPTISSMRRNHSDLVLQSLLNEEDPFNSGSPKLHTVKEDDDFGISPLRSKSNNAVSGKAETPEKGGSGGVARPSGSSSSSSARPSSASTTTGIRSSGSGSSIRTSVTNKDSVAMNLALHNLNQMSLKIQQMQLGK